jgi:hypothetical protein
LFRTNTSAKAIGRLFDVQSEVLRVHERDDAVEAEQIAKLIIDEKRLRDGPRIGEPRRFDENVIELVPSFHQVAEDADQIASHGAADAAVVHFEHFFVCIDDERLIDADLAEFVLDHRDPFAVIFGEDPVEQRRFPRTQKAGQHRDGNVIHWFLALQ